MASSDLSDEDFLGSLGISLDEVDLMVDADTYASMTGIFAQLTMTPADFSVISGIPFGIRPIELYDDWRIDISSDRMVELIGIDLPRIVEPGFATPALSVSRRWKEKFNPSILKCLENLAHLEEYDWAGAILSRMYDDMCDLSRGHGKLSGTYYFWETWAFEYFPYTRPELLQTDLGSGLAPLAWRWYKSNLHTFRRKKLLKELRAFFDTCPLEQVPGGLVNQMMELILGLQQEVAAA
ncbi:hypothetical protein JCGZ_14945 [Jatropha curcas]|uniref:Aminotransferase-like plant mobile domain-containing protein n=1 Tax=Jatropha curcas TaxID=180498 RepID=A0A067K7X5_JATCU|nr:hypothetical protein JCGZ_14945 [Jatropha curcas]